MKPMELCEYLNTLTEEQIRYLCDNLNDIYDSDIYSDRESIQKHCLVDWEVRYYILCALNRYTG